ncbi:MAG: hypothetical protein WCI55_16795 [Armatimonadota bacterium]
MKWGKFWNVFIVTLVLLLSPVAILYGLMMPKDPHFEYKFLAGHKPIQVGLIQDIGGGHDGSEFAVYRWRAPFAETVHMAKIELAGLSVKNHSWDFVEFLDKSGGGVGLMATKLTKSRITFSDKDDVKDSNYVTVIAQRRLPVGLWSELRVIFFRTRF